ncbi:MAG TPA: hypothetical protein VGF35_01500 [Steroidobacteraceae bacterium]
MSTAAFTTLHVVISLIGIATGLLALIAMGNGRDPRVLTATFLLTTVLTSVTGFFFHSAHFGPPHVIGVVSLAILAVALYALYGQHLTNAWRGTYVVTAAVALYLNCLVGVIQAFQKIAALHALAPTQTKEPPLVIGQLLLLVLIIYLTRGALRRFPGRSSHAVV